MSKPTTRMLTALELLQRRGRISGAVLAQHLGINRRSVRRYIAMLEELGIPIAAERGRDGAYLLVSGFKLPPMMFTDEEALALSLGLLASRQLGLGETTTAVVSAQAKLERVMPANLRERVSKLNDAITLDWLQSKEKCNPQVLAALSAAAQFSTRARIRHRSNGGAISEREFDCYGLVHRSGSWYAVGWCQLRNDLRSFRLDRISSVKLLTTRFTRPREFNAARELLRSIATLPRAHSIEVLLKTDLAAAQSAILPAVGVLESVDDGVVLRAEANDLDWFAGELARVPFGFSIRKPVALRRAVGRLGKRLMASV